LELNCFEKILFEVANGFIMQMLSPWFDIFQAKDADIIVLPTPVSVAVIKTPSDKQ
jgi:hypothetical protein